MRGFTDNFPMPVSRYTENRRADLEAAGIEILAESDACGIGMAREPDSGDLFVLNHLEYDADTLGSEYHRDRAQGLDTALPHGYFPGDDPQATPVNFWRPYAYLLISNWINDLYRATPFDLERLAKG